MWLSLFNLKMLFSVCLKLAEADFAPPVCLPSGDGDDDEEGREERLPSCYDYVMHFLTVFWKVLFACVPPTEYWNGWACFCVSISVIGLLTAVIGDLASHFGCTVGLRDTVTAVVFVALGTSIPGEWTSHCIRAGKTYFTYTSTQLGKFLFQLSYWYKTMNFKFFMMLII